jgi:hypothetical protein
MTKIPTARGYMVASALEYTENNYDEPTRKRMLQALSPDVREAVRSIDKVQWYPRRYAEELLTQIASVHIPDEEKVHDALVGVGRTVAQNATTSFLRLFMKIMTPSLFFRKLNDLWARDHREGEITCDLSKLENNIISIELKGIDGYPHIGPVGGAFVMFALERMGKTDVRVETRGWSLQTPAPSAVEYYVTWK